MTQRLRRKLVLQAVLASLIVSGACHKAKDSGQVNNGPPPGMGGPGMMGGPGWKPTPIKGIMNKLTKGRQSLTSVIGEELKQDPPPWDTIQPQTKEFVELASSMSKYDPPKGSKESWEKQTSAYTESAKELDKAAQTKDKAAALAAHDKLATSCKACHDAHRGGGPGMGPPGGFGPPGKGFPGGPPGGRPGAPPSQ
jgi:XXXCH domain-containing protein